MSQLTDLKPTRKSRVIDLVQEAGVDVGDWGNSSRGANGASANPKYCYEWAFVEPGKVVVLNLWYAHIEERAGAILCHTNIRDWAREFSTMDARATWVPRAHRMGQAIQDAVKNNLPVRVIVLAGKLRGADLPNDQTSKVEKRQLDNVGWAVTAYDWNTGECTIMRGVHPARFVDQFSVQQNPPQSVEQRIVSGRVFVRSADVRARVLQRAKGKCEWCGDFGFKMADGRIYIETHHVIPLSQEGADAETNVVALCPNHHREAHHGTRSSEMREALLGGQNRPR